MVDLARWLGQQLGADAAEIVDPYAEKAWHARRCESVPDALYPDRETGACDCGVPARVLREIDAKRRLLARYEQAASEYAADSRAYDHESEIGRERTRVLGEAVRLAALSYIDRDGYREEWSP